KVNIKGAPKKTRYSQAERSTKRDPSCSEHVEALYPDTPRSQPSGQKIARKKNQSPKPSPAPPIRKWPAK
ncbi:hypothetical protein A2U01_0089964, partial [Trifolium medium]|nr:hypothetical protein [Trifolium medium]